MATGNPSLPGYDDWLSREPENEPLDDEGCEYDPFEEPDDDGSIAIPSGSGADLEPWER